VKKVEQIRVFVASPGDVQAERDRMPEIRDALNRTLGTRLGIAIDLWRWEKDQRPRLGDLQAWIDGELDQADVVVALFWKRFGEPTKKGRPSPTAGEVLDSIERWKKTGKPELLLYFCERPFLPDAKELEQYGKVLEFKRAVGEKGGYKKYVEVDEFGRLVREHLEQAIHDLIEGRQKKKKPLRPETRPGAKKAAFDRERYLRHVEKECGAVVLTGLLKDEIVKSVDIEKVYVPLYVKRPRPARGGAEAGATHPSSVKVPRDAFGELAAALERQAEAGGLRPSRGASKGSSRDRARLETLVARALEQAGAPAAEARDGTVLRTVLARIASARREPLPQAVARVSSTIEVDRVFAYGKHVLIEGEAGSGKTTALKHIAMELVRSGDTGAPEIPVFVRLGVLQRWMERGKKAAGDASVLLDYLQNREERFGGASGWIEREIRSGRAVLLLDGLDEVPDPELRQRAAAIVSDFARARSTKECRIALTSRPEGLSSEIPHTLENAGGLAHCALQPLDEDQIDRFVKSWYLSLILNEGDALARKDDLVARIARSLQLRELAGTPIMLTAIAVLHYAKRTLPERAAELYDHLVRALCGRWDEAKRDDPGSGEDEGASGKALGGPLTLEQKIKFLQELAFRIHAERAEARRIPRGVVLPLAKERFSAALGRTVEDEEAAALVENMAQRSGLVIHEGPRDFAFRHQQFQEFLVARRVCDVSNDSAAELGQHLAESWWRRVITLAPAYKAINSGADGRRLLEDLAGRTLQIEDPGGLVFALSTLMQAAADLEEFEVDEIDRVVEQLAPKMVRVVMEARQPGELRDRVRIARALGTWGSDHRLQERDRWVLVPAGPFVMGGDDRDSFDSEKPVHQVDVPTFEIQRWAVTVGEYARFVDPSVGKGYSTQRWWEPEGWAWRKSDKVDRPEDWEKQVAGPANLPVVGVSSWEARAYCRWLASSEPVRADRGPPRLPTEAEWEKAARGGEYLRPGERNPLPRRIYPWGDEWSPFRANVHETGLGERAPVGCFPSGSGPYGIWDQAGNVWEWCEDTWHENYEGAPTNGRAWVDRASELRVIRGGGFISTARHARSASRRGGRPSRRWVVVGFRPAQAVTT